MPKGRWVRCTPEWVTKHNKCGETVRRPILEPIPEAEFVGEPDYRATGHEHLMLLRGRSDEQVSPLAHESGEPA